MAFSLFYCFLPNWKLKKKYFVLANEHKINVFAEMLPSKDKIENKSFPNKRIKNSK